MADQETYLQAGVDADEFLVGPSVILIQAADNYSITGNDGTGFPAGIQHVVNVATGAAMTGNGWEHLGYTENVNPTRNRTVVTHDSDQEARVEEVHDVWENGITVTALQCSLAKLRLFWQGKATDPSAVADSTPAQQKLDIGNPTTIQNRRVAILHPDKLGYLLMIVYRKASLRSTGGPTFSRTGRVEFPLEITAKPDTRETDVDARIMRIFRTTSPVT